MIKIELFTTFKK